MPESGASYTDTMMLSEPKVNPVARSKLSPSRNSHANDREQFFSPNKIQRATHGDLEAAMRARGLPRESFVSEQ